MNIEELQRLCLSFPGVTEDVKWEDHLCFNIGGKMFLITSLSESPTTASFKVSDEEFEAVSGSEGFKPAAYLARYKWVYTDDINNLGDEELSHFAKQSYELIKSKLPKKILKEIENSNKD